MFLQPFLGALIILRHVTWPVFPALAAVVIVFILREPLIVLARQRWVWRDVHPETAFARKYVLAECALLACAGAALLLAWPWWLLISLGGVAAALIAFAVYMTVKNRQRSIVLQLLSALGLSSSVLAACLAVNLAIPGWAWWFWGLHAAYFLAGILVIHVRLETRIAARKGADVLIPAVLDRRREALCVAAAMLVASFGILWIGQPWFALATGLAALGQFYDLYTAHRPEVVATPMTKVGQRALLRSLGFTGLLMVGSWNQR
jgi:hypothetical protein